MKQQTQAKASVIARVFTQSEIIHIAWLGQVFYEEKADSKLLIKAFEKPNSLSEKEFLKCKQIMELIPYKPLSKRRRKLEKRVNYVYCNSKK